MRLELKRSTQTLVALVALVDLGCSVPCPSDPPAAVETNIKACNAGGSCPTAELNFETGYADTFCQTPNADMIFGNQNFLTEFCNFPKRAEIASVGSVCGLGAINAPTAGFSVQVAGNEGHGYVVHTREGNTYGFHVRSIAGDIVTIRYAFLAGGG